MWSCEFFIFFLSVIYVLPLYDSSSSCCKSFLSWTEISSSPSFKFWLADTERLQTTLLDIKVDPARCALWAVRDQPRILFIWPPQYIGENSTFPLIVFNENLSISHASQFQSTTQMAPAPKITCVAAVNS